ncbi:hypothetical protein K470DRAFT_276419 [Piedraia hortae CBS 480.64]|uniref:Uncharacterized protein n=1 Tax=Piedraia hortae CBS 480.64 TaxID=1314780 RepID=A0A6A7C0Z5_9PEZI|nr:hypothetical protein K470DRAFT_276419 [Piedraia hortae CBS 480.64]
MPCDRPGHYHEWPLIADMVLTVQRCERFCGYCAGEGGAKEWDEAARLRRHVEDVHIRRDGRGTHPHLIFNPHWKEGGNPNKPPKGFRIDGEPRKQPIRGKDSYRKKKTRTKAQRIEAAYPNICETEGYALGSAEDRDIRVITPAEHEGQSQGHAHTNLGVPATNNQAPNAPSRNGPSTGAPAAPGTQYAHHRAPNGSVNLNNTPRQSAPAYVSNNGAMHHAVSGRNQAFDSSSGNMALVDYIYRGATQSVDLNTARNMAYQQNLTNTIVSLPRVSMGYAFPHHAGPYAHVTLGTCNMIETTMNNVPKTSTYITSGAQMRNGPMPFHSNMHCTNVAGQQVGIMAPPTGNGLSGLPSSQGYYNYAGIMTPFSDGCIQSRPNIFHNGPQGHYTPRVQGSGLSLFSGNHNMGSALTIQQGLTNFGGQGKGIQNSSAYHDNDLAQNTAPNGNSHHDPDDDDFESVHDQPTGNTEFDSADNELGFGGYEDINEMQVLPVNQNSDPAHVLDINPSTEINNAVATRPYPSATAVNNTNISPANTGTIAPQPTFIATGANKNSNDPNLNPINIMHQVLAVSNSQDDGNNQQFSTGTDNVYIFPTAAIADAISRLSDEDCKKFAEAYGVSLDESPGDPSVTGKAT